MLHALAMLVRVLAGCLGFRQQTPMPECDGHRVPPPEANPVRDPTEEQQQQQQQQQQSQHPRSLILRTIAGEACDRGLEGVSDGVAGAVALMRTRLEFESDEFRKPALRTGSDEFDESGMAQGTTRTRAGISLARAPS